MARPRNSKRLQPFLDEQRRPVYFMDDRRRIIYCNDVCAAWCGLAAAQLIGVRCDYDVGEMEGGATSIAAGLCPPPEAFAGQDISAKVTCPGENGVRRRKAQFFSLEDGVLAILDLEDSPKNAPRSLATAPDSLELHDALRESTAYWRRQSRRLIGESLAMRRVRRQVEAAGKSRARVLIYGPPGSGREHAARAIHAFSDSAERVGPFVPLDCRIVDAEMLQSSITALMRHCRELEVDPPGLLALLDIEALSAEAQAELAGFLEIESFDLQIIATSPEPFQFQKAGFREGNADNNLGGVRSDLQHALSLLTIELPPLAARRSDIPMLAQYFLETFNQGQERQLSGFSDEAFDLLAGYEWPGNLDELADAVNHARQQADDVRVQANDLPERLHVALRASARPARVEEHVVLDDVLVEIETELIRRALAQAKGNKSKTARLLGVSRARLHRRIQQLGLDGGDVD